MEGEVQGVHLNAAIGVLVTVSVIPAGGVSGSVPLVSVTRRHGNRSVHRFMDRQVKRVDTLAAVGSGVRVGVGAGFSVRYAVPLVTFAGNSRRVTESTVVHRQMQRHHAVTA